MFCTWEANFWGFVRTNERRRRKTWNYGTNDVFEWKSISQRPKCAIRICFDPLFRRQRSPTRDTREILVLSAAVRQRSTLTERFSWFMISVIKEKLCTGSQKSHAESRKSLIKLQSSLNRLSRSVHGVSLCYETFNWDDSPAESFRSK